MKKKKIILFAGIILGFLVLSYAFVPQVLQGKIVNQSDIYGWQGMAHETMEWNAAHPSDPAKWTGSMFSGMPTTTIQLSTRGDITQGIYDFLLLGRRPATYFFVSLLGAFLMLLAFGVSPLVAAGGAVAVTFCAYNLQIIQVGHNTKMQAIAFLPWVMASLVFTYRAAAGEIKGKWQPLTVLGSALFGLALSFQIKANHPQISYYLALLILIYVIAFFIGLLRRQDGKKFVGRFFIASALLLFCGLAGIGSNAVKLMPIWEYTSHSMRGGSGNSADASDGEKGLKLDYATAWSYGWEELPNLVIPNFNGGASDGAVNPKHSETYKLLKNAGQSNAKETCRHLPLYWGPQPFTAGPMYMGAVTFFLFLLGLLFCKGREKWWVVAATVLSVLLALGNHLMWFTRLFYQFAPLYNKFRTVSMALVALQFTLPVMAFIVLDRIMKEESVAAAFRKRGWIALAIGGGFCLICYLFPSIAGNFISASDSQMPQPLVDALAADRRSLLQADALRSLLLICGAWALLFWGCVKSGASRRTAVLLVCILGLCDLVFVGKRYLGPEDFVTPRTFNNQFAKRSVDEYILQDTDPSFRVLDLTTNVFNDSHPSYWHKSIGGYSPAKLQIYQQYIEKHLQGDLAVLNRTINETLKNAGSLADIEAALPELESLSKLNCRYIVLDGDYPPLEYPYAKGNAWFEDAEGEITMTSYTPDALTYSYSSESGGKAVFSEVYYPDGWTATLEDGTVLPIELSDEVLRSVILPGGSHELTMRFAPSSYSLGKGVSLASSILLILIVILSAAGAVVYGRKEWK